MPIACRNPSCCYTGLIALIAIALASYGCASGPTVVGNLQAVEGDARAHIFCRGGLSRP